jgi:hypothetical protein
VSGHEARAVRRNGAGAIWFAECPKGCQLPRAAGKEHAQWLATEHRIREAAKQLTCECYHPDEMEFFGNHPCPRCQIIDALGGAA